jgi:tetratricopeptide (TPR) repeat protein
MGTSAEHGAADRDETELVVPGRTWLGGSTELRVNLALLGVLGFCWGAVSLADPAAALDPADPTVAELAELEDAFAADRDSPELARRLADHYLALRSPQLAVAALSAASPAVREDPSVLHRLAQSYEETGRMDDAVATARLAVARCARALGTSDASDLTPAPSYTCSERTYAALDMHATALAHLQRWGVTDVHRDPRARTAYALAVRSARIVSASAE